MNTFGKDIMFKNLACGMRVQVLGKIFPDAKFIVIKRNPVDICASLLRGRKQRYRTIENYWSLEPREIKEILKMNPYDQVAAQVVYTYKQIKKDLSGLKHIEIRYEDLCSNTRKVIDQTAELGLQKRNDIIRFNLKLRTNAADKDTIRKIRASLERFR